MNSDLHTRSCKPGKGYDDMTHYAHPDKVLAAVESIAAQAGETRYQRDPQAEAVTRAAGEVGV